MHPDEEKEISRLEDEAQILAKSYREIADTLAFKDLMYQIDEMQSLEHDAAEAEISNPARAVALLQRANAYDTIRTYIRQKLV